MFNYINFADADIEIIDGDRGANYPKKSEFSSSGYCLFLSATNVTADGFEFDSCEFISKEKDLQLRKGRVQKNDVILTTRGTIGNVALVDHKVPFDNLRINSGMLILRANPKSLSPRFLYYYMRSKIFQERMRSVQSGAAQPQLPISTLVTLDLPIPPIAVQNEIGETIKTFDELIFTNYKKIRALEQTSKLLYKEWFVNFKFPNHEKIKMVDSEHPDYEMIPEGWKVGSLSDYCERVESGGTPDRSKANYWSPKNIQWLTSGEVRAPIIIETEQFISEDGLNGSSAKIWPIGTTVVAMYGATAGQVTILATNCSANQACCGLIPKKEYTSLLYLKAKSSTDIWLNRTSGAAQQNLNKSSVANLETLLPDASTLAQFDKIIMPILTLQANLYKSIKVLTKLRDLLLSKLISGEIDVSEISEEILTTTSDNTESERTRL